MSAGSLGRMLVLVSVFGCADGKHGGPDGPSEPTGTGGSCAEWFTDADDDGFGALAAAPVTVCPGDPTEGLAPEATDCDDLDPAVNPAADEVCDPIDVDEDCSGAADDLDPGAVGAEVSWPDLDEDGFGDALAPATPLCDPEDPRATNGDDCDDRDPSVFPGAPEGFGDGIDQDCSGDDLWHLFDDFELGVPDPAVFQAVVTDVVMSDADAGGVAASGRWSADLGAGGELASVPLDAMSCDNLTVDYQVRRPPRAFESDDGTLAVEYWNDGQWIEVERVRLAELWQWDFRPRRVVVPGGAARDPALQVRIVLSADLDPAERVYVDDVRIACPGPDADGDSYGFELDCDDADPDHWSDCGICVDTDGDDFGDGCDRGADCDDTEATIAPGQPDVDFDGVDQDCDGLAGPFADDMEDGHLDIWTEPGVFLPTAAHGGVKSMALSDYNGPEWAETIVVDTSGCDTLAWSFWVLHPDNAPDSTVSAFYWDGAAWNLLVRADGDWELDWDLYEGVLADPRAIHPDFRLRFDRVTAYGLEFIFIDDLVVTCGPPDADGDLVRADVDCDDADGAHWLDCQGGCADADADDFGAGCDLGEDCDDSDGSVYPGALDPFGDTVDSSCDGYDGQVLEDGFESPVLDPDVWVGLVGTDTAGVEGTTLFVNTGERAEVLYAEDGGLQTVPFDTSPCPAVWFSSAVKRGEQIFDPWAGNCGLKMPTPDQVLSVSYFDGSGWVVAQELPGIDSIDPTFATWSGVIDDPAAMGPAFALRFMTTSDNSCGPFYLDDVVVACTEPDGDGDGIVPIADCDDADPDHWSDCGACVDGDDDGFGVGCDLGPDCDDLDPQVHPGAPEVEGDGLDANCDGFQLATVLSDDFDAGSLDPARWAASTGQVGFSEFYRLDGQALWFSEVGSATTQPIDTSACPTIAWRAWLVRGPQDPNVSGAFHVRYVGSDGVVSEVFTLPGGRVDLDSGGFYQGEIDDPAAFWPGFQLELALDGYTIFDGGFLHVDDLAVGCSELDLDGDASPEAVDCDDADPSHWSDCGRCVDADGDDFGVSCDLGPDCDDLDPAAHPGALDLPLDGLDPDCSGVDGPGLRDDFEAGGLATPWQAWGGESGPLDHPPFEYDPSPVVASEEVFAGAFSLKLQGQGFLESIPLDTSSCAELQFRYRLWQGALEPLVVEWWDGASWVLAGVSAEGHFGSYGNEAGTISDPAALSTGFRVRLTYSYEDSWDADEVHYLDDFEIVCL